MGSVIQAKPSGISVVFVDVCNQIMLQCKAYVRLVHSFDTHIISQDRVGSMDQDTRHRESQRDTTDRTTVESSRAQRMPNRQRDLSSRFRGTRVTASAYLENLLQTVTSTINQRNHLTAPIATTGPIYDRCLSLVHALGDPDNPEHIRAAEELVNLGPTALPALVQALHPDGQWLTAYRAAEVLGEIGDRRAAQPLIEALNHPNSNVRWSAVRALSLIGNTRALFALRRVARGDRSKTSWGESVAGVAQSAVDQMQNNNLVVKSLELVKTAVSTVVLLLALYLAWTVFNRVQGEVSTVGIEPTVTMGTEEVPATDAQGEEAVVDATATIEPTTAPAATVNGVILTAGNVRSVPAVGDNVIGEVSVDDEIIFVATTPDRTWFKIVLGSKRSATSSIGSGDGSGWINEILVDPPSAELPIEDMLMPTRPPAATAIPTPEAEAPTPEAEATAEPTPATDAGGDAGTEPTVDPLLPPTETPVP